MSNKNLFILLEGDDDERFFENVVTPLLRERYYPIKLVQYQRRGRKKIIDFLKAIEAMKAEYIFVRDLNGAPCITFKKNKIKSKCEVIKEDKIIIVVKKIEGWYLAGLNERALKSLRIRKKIGTTNEVDKEEFNHITPKNLSEIEFKLKILRIYDVEIAKVRNKSFEYFLNKWINDPTALTIL